MEKLEFVQLGEELYYEHLDNGLDVYILPKQGFIKPMPPLLQNTGPLIISLFL